MDNNIFNNSIIIEEIEEIEEKPPALKNIYNNLCMLCNNNIIQCLHNKSCNECSNKFEIEKCKLCIKPKSIDNSKISSILPTKQCNKCFSLIPIDSKKCITCNTQQDNKKFCYHCNEYTLDDYEHCYPCGYCSSNKEYEHCDECEQCNPSNYEHCDICDNCHQPKQKCIKKVNMLKKQLKNLNNKFDVLTKLMHKAILLNEKKN